jgi:hypothetical protein
MPDPTDATPPLGEESASSGSAGAEHHPGGAQRGVAGEQHPDSDALDRRQAEMGATRRPAGPPLGGPSGTTRGARDDDDSPSDIAPTEPAQ